MAGSCRPPLGADHVLHRHRLRDPPDEGVDEHLPLGLAERRPEEPDAWGQGVEADPRVLEVSEEAFQAARDHAAASSSTLSSRLRSRSARPYTRSVLAVS